MTIEKIATFHQAFASESDRACVILGAAAIDEALRTLIKAYLVISSTDPDSLLDGANAPLASLSARIDICQRLGLLSARFAKDLHVIRRIRNSFAHDVSGCTFDNPSVRDRISELGHSSGLSRRLGRTSAVAIRLQPSLWPSESRGIFELTVSWMLFALHERPTDLQRLSAAPEEGVYGAALTRDQVTDAEEHLRQGNRAFFPDLDLAEFDRFRELLLERDKCEQKPE